MLQQRVAERRRQRRLFLERLEERSLLATMTWDGSFGANWSDAANWVGDIAPTSGDDLFFPAGAANLTNNNNLPAGTSFNTIVFTGGGYNVTGNAISLVGGLTANNTLGDTSFLPPITLQNAQTIMSANPGTTLTLGAIDTANLVGATSSAFGAAISALTLDGAGTTIVGGVISGQGSIYKLGGGTATLRGNNTYTGLTDVRQGFLRAEHAGALGPAGSGDTQIQAGAQLQVAGTFTMSEHFAVREGGVGFGNGTDPSGLGALRAVSGTVMLDGNIDLAGTNNVIGADLGATLIANGVIANATSATNRLTKVGAGIVRFTGTQANVYRGDTVVLQGTLELGKTAGVNAIGGNLVIGDHIGGDNAAIVRLLANNQIPHVDYFGVTLLSATINSSGLLNFNGFTDTIGNLTMFTGSTYSADVNLNSGTLLLGGASLTLNAFNGSSGVTPAATITNGMFDLGTYFSGAGGGQVKTFTINDTQLNNVASDLVISANLTSAADVGLNKAGAGTLVLSGTNALTGPVSLSAGIVGVGSNSAFGTGIVSVIGANLRAFGADRTVATPVSLDADVAVLGDLDITFTSPATLTGARIIRVMDPNAVVTFAAPVGEGIFGSQALTKAGRGTLQFTAANTLSSTITISDDGGTVALAGNGTILNVSGITINQNGVLRLDNSGTNLSDRVNDVTVITNNSGEVLLVGNPTAATTETTGVINTGNELATTISVQNTSAGGTQNVVLVANAMGTGATRNVNFQALGGNLSATGPNRIVFQNSPGNLQAGTGVILGSRVTGAAGVDLATYGNAPEGIAIVPMPASGYTSDLANAGTLSNVRITTPGTVTLTTSKQINSLILGPGVTLAGADVLLNVNSGILMFTGSGLSAINVESLNTSSGSIFVEAGMNATIGGSFGGNIVAGSVYKAGAGRLILTGDNTFNGNLAVNQGFVNIQRSSAVGSPVGATNIRQGATLEIEQTTFGAVNIGVEQINVTGVGVSATGQYADAVGALRNVAGNNTHAGRIGLGGQVTDLTGPTLLNGYHTANVIPSTVFVNVATGSRFTHTESIVTNIELIKIGGGTLEYAGAFANTYDAATRILEGTLDFNKDPGINSHISTVFIGSDRPGAPAATLRLSKNEQIRDSGTAGAFIHSSGLLDVGQTEGFGGTLTMVVAANGGADVTIGAGGTLTTNGDLTLLTAGSGNATGATISGGTLALQYQGVIGGATLRTWQINDGALGNDLTVSSAIVDGTGLQSYGITKNGFGALELAGNTPNTYTGTTTMNEGTLVLNKGTGTGGVAAMSGPLTVGDNNSQSGFAGSDVVRWLQANQLPDFSAAVIVNATGKLELNGRNETIGNVDVQTALTMQASSVIDLGGATLGVNGNIATAANSGAVNLWTPIVAPRIINGTLNLGGVPRSIDVGGDQSQIPYELEISANITGTAGLLQANTGTLLLSGDNSGLSGEVYRGTGNFAVGSNTAFGTGTVYISGGHLTTYTGPRSLANEFALAGATIVFLGGNGFASSGAIGGGGNNLTFTGPVNITGGTMVPVTAIAGVLEFAGGLGETFNTAGMRKQGPGTMVFSSPVTLSSGLTIGQDAGNAVNWNGGTVVLRGNGTYLNAGFFTTAVNTGFNIGTGGTLQIDNSQGNLPNRLGNLARIEMQGGNLALVSGAGVQVTESFGELRGETSGYRGEVHVLTSPAPGTNATWRFSNLAFEATNNGIAFKFVGRGQNLASSGTSRLGFNTLPTLDDGILPQGVLQGSGGFDFAAVVVAPVTAPFDNFIAPLTSGANFSPTLTGATATMNVKLSASEAIPANLTVNALLLANGSLVVSGAGVLTVNSGLVINGGVGNQITAAGLTLGGNEGLIYVNERTDLSISSPIAGAAVSLAKGGLGLLTLSGANTFVGTTRATEGILRAASSGAFGTTAGGVTNTYGATIELTGGINVPTETLTLLGLGEANLGSAVPLRSIGGVNTWQGAVILNSNRTALDIAAGTLIIGDAGNLGVVSSNGWNKFGSGTLQFAGTGANTTANTAILWQGTVELNKSPGVPAISNTLIVGDFFNGGDNVDVLRLLADNQLIDTANFLTTIQPSGLLDLNGRTELLTPTAAATLLQLNLGSTASGDVQTGATGLLSFGPLVGPGAFTSSLTIGVALAGGAPAPATITGNVQLTATGTTINVGDGAGVEDLVLRAVLSGAAPLTITGGNGRTILDPRDSANVVTANTYTGNTVISQGEVVVRSAGALGSNTAGTSVTGSSLLLDGSGLIAGETLTLNGGGYGGQGVLRNIAGNNSLTGNVVLAATSTISVNALTDLDINSEISGVGFGVTKLLTGSLTYSGAAANIYTGTTTVNEGTLILNKAAGTEAFRGALTIGNDTGSAGNHDVVQLNASNQILDNTVISITSTGRLNIGGNSETLGTGAITLTTAGTQSPAITTTGAGVFNLIGNLTVNSAGGTFTTKAPGATIAGNLNLQDGARTLTANDAGLGIMELVIDAAINSGTLGTGTILSNGTGLLVLTNNNTAYTGNTTISGGGGLVLRNSGALGPNTNVLNIPVASNLFFTNYGLPLTTVTISNPINLNVADLTIRGDNNIVLAGPISTLGAANRVLNLTVNPASNLTISGQLNLSSDTVARTFTVNTNTFHHAATLSSVIRNGVPTATAVHSFIKGGTGTLIMSGDSNSGANIDFLGATTIGGGIVRMAHANAFGGTIAEQQQFPMAGVAGSTFTITYNTQVTSTLTFDAGGIAPDAATVAAALNALPSIARTGGTVSVSSSAPGTSSTIYTITFGGALSGIDVTAMTVAGLLGATAAPTVTTPVLSGGGTIVNTGFTLQVVPGVVYVREPLSLNGQGLGNLGAMRMIDVTPGVAETVTWPGIVNFALAAASTWAGVDGGGANPDRLILTGSIANANTALAIKTGPGELEFGGLTDNGQVTFTGLSGLDDGFEIRGGTVYFNKPNVLGIDYNAIIGGTTITVGDGGGGVGGDRLILLGSSINQIGGTMPVTVNPSGLLTMTGTAATEQLPAAVNIARWLNSAGQIDSTATRTFILNNNVNVTNLGYTDSATPAAQIAGLLSLVATRTFTVADSIVPNAAAEDLVVSAVMSGAAGVGITKDGLGTMAVTAANTYLGTTTVNAGTQLNGIAGNVGGTLIARGGGVLGTGPLTIADGASVTLDNSATNVSRVGDAVAVTLAGSLNLIGNSAGSTEVIGVLTINARNNGGAPARVTIDSSAGGITELQPTGLTRGTSATAEFVGVGSAIGMLTNSRITVTAGASPFTNNVMSWATLRSPGNVVDLISDADGVPGLSPFSLGAATYTNNINDGGIVRLTGGTHTLTGAPLLPIYGLLIEGGATVNSANFDMQMGNGAAGLIYSASGTNAINLGATGEFTYGTREALFLVESGSTLTANGLLNGSGALRVERGGTLVLTGDNEQGAGGTFTGTIDVGSGTLRASHVEALNPLSTAAVFVRNLGSLILEADMSITGNRPLNLSGPGISNTGALVLTTGSDVVWGNGTSNLLWNQTPGNLVPLLINVAGTGTLNLAGTTTTANAPLVKIGAGSLEFSGSTANANTSAISVNEGTLILNKQLAVAAVVSALTIEDMGNFDPAGTATVTYAGVGTNNIADGINVIINDQGVLSLGASSDTIAALTVNGSRVGSANVATGAGLLQINGGLNITGGTIDGNIVLNSNLAYNVNSFGPGGQAVINGTLNLNTLPASNAARTFNISENYAVNDLVINAAITNGRILKSGNGTLALTNATNVLSDFNEIQTLSITDTVTSFRLTFNGVITPDILAVTTPAIQTALDTVLGAGTTTVGTVTGGGGVPYVFTVTFTGILAGVNVANFTGTVTSGAGTVTNTTVAGAEGAAGINLSAGSLAVNATAALGGATLNLTTATSTLRPIAGTALTLSSRIVVNPGLTTILGGRRDFGGTDALTLSGTIVSVPVLNNNNTYQIDDPLLNMEISGVIAGGSRNVTSTSIPLVKTGFGKLILSSTNTFVGNVQVSSGTLNLRNNGALGGATPQQGHVTGQTVIVVGGAAIELEGGVTISDRTLRLDVPNPPGFSAGYLGDFNGALRSRSGLNTWRGPVDLRSFDVNARSFFIGVDAGQLTIDGSIVATNNTSGTLANNLIKVGGGTLVFGGGVPNLYTGTTAVLSGTLVLEKTAGANAIAGTLVVGDNFGTDIVEIRNADQILNTAQLQVQSSGQVNLTSSPTVAALNEVQTIQFSALATGGTWDLNILATNITGLPFSLTPAALQDRINQAVPVGNNVRVGGIPGLIYTFTYLGINAGQDVGMPGVDATNMLPALLGSTITINQEGITYSLPLPQSNETVGATQLFVGATSSASINIGSSLFLLNGDVTVTARPGITTSIAAQILGTGQVSLLPANAAVTATRTFTVNDGSGLVELNIIPTIIDKPDPIVVANLAKAGAGRLTLAADNTFSGTVAISGGVLRIQHADGLGDTGTVPVAASVTVAAGTSLEFDIAGTNTIDNELFSVNGNGIINGAITPLLTAATGTGAVRNIAGNNTLTVSSPDTVVTMAGNTLFAVNSGRLTINGPVGPAAAVALIKAGTGDLELAGSTDNLYQGNTFVNEGKLVLNKSGAARAIGGPLAGVGELFIGDNLGADNSDSVEYAATAGPDQINDFRPIHIARTGRFNLNNISDTISGTFFLDVGPTMSGDVLTGTGVLTMSNNTFQALSQAGQTATSPAATLQGLYDGGLAGNRTFTVHQGPANVELDVSAVLSAGAAAVTWAKQGRGAAIFSGNNTYAGTTSVNVDGGTLIFNSLAPAAVPNASNFTVNAGATLGGNGTINGTVTVAANGSNLAIGGTINPGSIGAGANTGILTVNNNVTFNNRSELYVDLNGIAAGTGHDQLRITGAASTLTISNTLNNGANLNGNTGGPIVAGMGVKVIDKVSAGGFTGTPTVLTPYFANAFAPSGTITLGTRNYNFVYDDASGLPLGDGNDFVLTAIPSTVVWDGKVDGGGPITGSNNWSLGANWVGDTVPAPGDAIMFNDIGIGNLKDMPFNDFPAASQFGVITFANTSGSYTITGNSITLAVPVLAGVISNNSLDLPVSNSLNVPLLTSTASQLITVRDGSTLTVGSVTLVSGAPLTVNNGAAGADATGSIVFAGTVNGNAALTINLVGDATFNGAIGGVTPLPSITIATADDVAFNSTVVTTAVTGNVLQTTGTGTTTISGGTIGGTLIINNEAIALAGVNTTVTGNTTLNPTIGGVAQTAGGLITPSLTLTGTGAFSMMQPANDVNTIQANLAGSLSFRDTDDLLVTGTGINTGLGTVLLQTGTTLGINAPVQAGTGDIILQAGGAVTQTAALGAGTLELLGAGPYTLLFATNGINTLAANTTEAISFHDFNGFSVGTGFLGTVGVTTSNDDVLLSSAGPLTQTAPIVAATLTLQGAGPFTLTNAANDSTTLAGNTTGAITYTDANSLAIGVITAGAATVTVNSVAGALTDGNAAANNITAGAFVASAATGIGSSADPIETTLGGLEAITTSGGVFIANTGALVIGGVSAVNGVSATAGDINITSTLGMAIGETIASPGTVTLNGGTGAISTPTAGVDVAAVDLIATAAAGIDLDTNITNATLTTTGVGNVLIDEANGLNLAGLSVFSGTATINAAGALGNGVGAILSVNGNASFSGLPITLGTQAGDNLTFGSLTFNSTGAVTIDLNNATALSGASTADSLLFTSTGAINNLANASLNVTNAATLLAPSVALGSQAGDAINFGTLNFNSAGLVAIAEDSSTSIIGTNTAGSTNIVSGAALANAVSSSITVTGLGTFGGTSVDLGNQAGDTFNAGSVGFTSTGLVSITEDSSTVLGGNSTAGSLLLTSPATITNAATANVAVTGATTLNGTSITLGNVPGDVLSFGPITFTATGGVTIEENGALQLAGANTVPGAIVLTSVDAAGTGQDVIIPAGASVTSSTSTVTLNGGDDVVIGGAITSTLTTTINVDFGDFESPAVIEAAPGTGGTLTIASTSVITTPAVGSGGGTFLNGNDDFDTFAFFPQTSTEFRVNGFDPTATALGDILALDTSIATGAQLDAPGTIAPYLGSGSGRWHFTSPHQQVLFTNIEENSPPTPFHLTIDNSVSLIGNIVIMRDASQTRVQIRDTNNAGPIIFQGLLTSVLSVRVLGSIGADMVTIDDINTLPDFSQSVPGVIDNLNLTGTGEILFDGMGGNDTLVYNLNGPAVAQTYAIGIGNTPGSQAGEILSVGSGISLPTFFQNVELVQRIGTNATLGTSTIAGDSTSNTMAVTASGALTRVTATGYVPYEINNSSVGQLAVSGGVGNDLLDLISLGSGAGNPAINLNGGDDVDTIRVHGTSTHTGPVTLIGGMGSDIFQLSNTLNLLDALNQVDSIVAPVIVDGTDASLAGNNDQLIINDSGDTTFDNVLIGAVNPAGSADYRVEGITTTGGNDVVFRNIDTLVYTGTQGNDLIDAQFVNTTPAHDLSFATINGWLGADQFLLFTSDQVGGTSPAPIGAPSGLASINLNGDAPNNPNPTDGNDVFGEPAPGLIGTGSGNAGLSIPTTLRWIRPSVSTPITINGGRPTGPVAPMGDTIGDVLNLDLSALPTSAPLILATVSGIVATTGVQALAYSEIEDFNLALGNQLVNVQMGDMFVRGTAGADTIIFSKNPVVGAPDQTRIRLNTMFEDITTTGKTLVFAGASNDYVTMSNVEYPGEVYGEDGDDYIAGGIANDFLVGGLGSDQINASQGDNIVWGDNASGLVAGVLPQDAAVGGNDILSALNGNDVFYGGGGNDQVSPGAGNDYIYGGAGDDLLDGHLGDDRVYGGDGNDVISGSAGHDLLVGGNGNDLLLGRDGNDVLIGGDGIDALSGEGGDDLMISGIVFNEASSWVGAPTTTTFDANSYSRLSDNDAALMLLLSQWATLHDRSSLASVSGDSDSDVITTSTGNDDNTFANT